MTKRSWAPIDGIFRRGWMEAQALDEVEVPADPAMPQISTMLDGPAMGPILRRAVMAEGADRRLEIKDCQIVYVRCRPTQDCLVCYTLDIGDTKTGQESTRIVSARVYAQKKAERVLARRVKGARKNGLAVTFLPERQMILTAFPDDFRLRGMRQIMDPGKLERCLRTALGMPEAILEEPEDGTSPVAIVSYKPERSCLFRCAVRHSRADKGPPRIVFGRMYRDSRKGENIHRAMVALWNGEARRSGLLSVAEPLGYDPESRMLLQASLDGTLLKLLIGKEEFFDRLGAVARSLAAIHATPVQLTRERTVQSRLEAIEQAAPCLIRVLPAEAKRLGRILDQLRSTVPDARARPMSLIHGDFHTNQILIHDNAAAIFDFDAVSMGDAYGDLGSFLAHPERIVALGELDPSYPRRAADEFRRAYQEARREVLDMGRLLWHERLAWFWHAYYTLCQLRPGWRSRVAECLDFYESLPDERDRI